MFSKRTAIFQRCQCRVQEAFGSYYYFRPEKQHDIFRKNVRCIIEKYIVSELLPPISYRPREQHYYNDESDTINIHAID